MEALAWAGVRDAVGVVAKGWAMLAGAGVVTVGAAAVDAAVSEEVGRGRDVGDEVRAGEADEVGVESAGEKGMV